MDKVQGFRLGADDYVVKPVGALELIARVAAMLRRATGRTVGARRRVVPRRKLLTFGDIEIDAEDRTVKRAGALVEMSPREFDLLVRLYDAAGRLVSRKALMDEIWGYALGVTSRTLDQHIARLRNKIESHPGKSEYIVTVRKSGYRLRR